MDEENIVSKEEDSIKMDANEILLKSKAFVLVTIEEGTDDLSFMIGPNGNLAENIGLFTYAISVLQQKVQMLTSIDDEENDLSDL